jgi:hypothetical protein
MLPVVILGLIIGFALGARHKAEASTSSDHPALSAAPEPKLLGPIELTMGKPTILATDKAGKPTLAIAPLTPAKAHAGKVKKSREDLMLAAIEHANVTKDPRDYRAAAALAAKANKPKTSKTLASIADARAHEIAAKAKKVEQVAKVTGDPRALDVFAGLVEQIDQTELARRARHAAKAIRNGEVS